MATLEILMRLVSTLVIISVANAASYSVGGPIGGWDMITNLEAWTTSQSFVTGDNLVFKYMPSHDVVEVTKGDYDACQVSNPMQSFNDGSTTISLDSPGKRYFICSTLGHCAQGMKLEVNTLASSLTLPAPATAPSLAPSSLTLTAPATAPSLGPENSVSPLGGPKIFPFIPSVESPMSLASSVDSALTSASKDNTLSKTMVGFGFGILILLFCL